MTQNNVCQIKINTSKGYLVNAQEPNFICTAQQLWCSPFKIYTDWLYIENLIILSTKGQVAVLCALQLLVAKLLLRNRAEYHLILSRRGRRPSWLNQGIFRKIEQDNCFIIQQILIDYHFQNEKNYGSMMKTLKASNT